MEPIDWAKSFEIFGIGFGGVFSCLLILLCSIALFSRVVRYIEAMGKAKESEKE